MAEPILRCKMRVTEVLHAKDEHGETWQERVKLVAVTAVGDEENAKWAKWTPAASFEIYINNPDAYNQLSATHEFFVDFTPIE